MAGKEIDTLMQGKRNITVLAFRHPSTHLTFYHRCKSSPVLEEDSLLSILQGFSYSRQEHRRINTRHHLAMAEVFHIHHLYLRQLDILVSGLQFYQSILTLLGIVIAFHRRRSRSQKHLCLRIHVGKHDGCTAGMIAWSRILLFERGLVLFIDDDKSQFLERQKDCTSCSQDHIIGMPGELFLPDFHALCITIFRMIDTEPVAKDFVQSLHNLNRQGDFGQQIEHLPVFLDGFSDEMDIDFRLSAGSYTMQEHYVFLQHLHQYLIVSILLRHRQGLDLV